MEQVTPDHAELRDAVRQAMESEGSKPLSVAIVGQTGVGKSSLLNAVFGTDLSVGDIAPTTKVPEPVTAHGSSGHPVTFWDMPGFGESRYADDLYLEMYRDKLMECDVALWAVHADSRSVAYDQQFLARLLDFDDAANRHRIARKVTFVLTKSDLLAPPPWVFAKAGRSGFFVPGQELAAKLEQKARYFEEALASPHAESLGSRTYLERAFPVADDRFEVTERHVTFNGYMTAALCEKFSERHPAEAEVFERLRANHKVVACSAYFRYGLSELLSLVVSKIDLAVTVRFQKFIGDLDTKKNISTAELQSMGNIVVWDTRRDRKVFDFRDVKLK